MVSIDSMRWTLLCSLAVAATGCFSPDVPLDTDGPESGTDGLETESASGQATDSNSGTGTSNGPGGTMESGDPTTDGETDPSGDTDPAGDEPPQIESFSVNDSQTPEDVTQSSLVRLSAEVSDDVGVASVEFFDGEMSVGTATEAPYEVEVLVTSSDSGGHVYTARATDTVDQEATSDEVQLFVDVTGGEVVATNEGLFEGEQAFGVFGGMTAISSDLVVLAGAVGTDIENPESAVVTLDAQLTQISSTTLAATVPSAPVAFEVDRVLLPATRILGSMATPDGIEVTTSWRYEVLDSSVGELIPAAALQFAGGNDLVGAHATRLANGGFALATSPTTVSGFEADLDVDIWEHNLGVAAGEGAFVTSSASLPDGSIVLGISSSDGCQGTVADSCLRKVNSDGTPAWTLGLQSTPQQGGLAWDSQSGVFYSERVDGGLRVVHIDENADELASRVLTFANPLSTLGAYAAPDFQGGVVFAFATGQQQNDGVIAGEVGTLMRLDAGLDELWRANGVGPGSRPLATSTHPSGHLYVAGIEPDADGPTVFGVRGDIWVARADL